ncbi:MAG: UbiA family prenyltransferase [Sphingomonadaceae bacterium]
MSDTIVPDSEHRGLIARLPQMPRDLAMLARFDRPIGWWLLFWPCAWGLWLAGGGWQWQLLGWFLLGSIAMRGAGCVYNDIVDAALDRKVTRTASRPVARRARTKKLAWGWLLFLCAIGLIVLLQLRWQAAGGAGQPRAGGGLSAKRIATVAAGMVGAGLTWGAPVGCDARGQPDALAALYGGALLWCMGWRHDLTRCKTARMMRWSVSRVRPCGWGQGAGGRGCSMAARWRCGRCLFWLLRADWVVLLALIPVAAHLAWQASVTPPRSR